MSKKFSQQKAALTRAVNSGDYDKVVAATRKAVAEWADHPDFGHWPDDWARWQRALDDTYRFAHRAYVRGERDTKPEHMDMEWL